MKISELRKICEQLEKDIGPDVEVFLQIRDNEGRLLEQEYCEDAFLKVYGRLTLCNYKLKGVNRPWKTGVNMNQNSDI